MPETKPGRATLSDTKEFDVMKEKSDKLKADLLSKIKELTLLEVEETIKKQKVASKSTIDGLQGSITKLERSMKIWSNMAVIYI